MIEDVFEQTSRALLDVMERSNTPLLVVRSVDDAGTLAWVHVNTAYASLLGYTVAEVLATPVWNIVGPDQRAQMKQLVAAFRSGQPVPPALEVNLVDAHGQTIPVELTMSRREPVAVCMVHDMREHHGPLSLLEADRIGLVGALAAGFAHEINNPLTSVLLNLRALKKQVAHDPDLLHVVDDVTTGAERIANNVRAFQSLASRGVRRQLDLASVVASALRLATPTLAPFSQIVRQIFPVAPVIGEESRVGQAVLAMLLFSGSGFDREAADTSTNRVTVLVEERGSDAIVEVTDNGRELDVTEAERAFDPFFRSQVRGAGVGVGLGVARSVAAALGGEVTLARRGGGGAAILMRLPVVR